jgi:hypothetical protein
MARSAGGQAAATAGTALTDRLEVMELTARMGMLADARAWDELAGLFADPVRVDYPSLWGGQP